MFIQWAGNDVYGSRGYIGYTWHVQHPWVTQTWMDRETALNWPAKQKILVESGVRRIIALQTNPSGRSVTVVLGPQNGEYIRADSKVIFDLLQDGCICSEPYLL